MPITSDETVPADFQQFVLSRIPTAPEILRGVYGHVVEGSGTPRELSVICHGWPAMQKTRVWEFAEILENGLGDEALHKPEVAIRHAGEMGGYDGAVAGMKRGARRQDDLKVTHVVDGLAQPSDQRCC